MTKRPYQAPAVREVGSVADHTKANNFNSASDGVFVTVNGQIASLGS
jgi:hypothetical protein